MSDVAPGPHSSPGIGWPSSRSCSARATPAEGHYLYVSKNLIEMIACLALVFIPTGRWVGLDALLFNWRDRRRARDDSRREPLRTIEPRPQLKDTGSIRLS